MAIAGIHDSSAALFPEKYSFVVFETISQSLGKAFSASRGTGKITEGNIRDGMQQVRKALLEAAASAASVLG